MTKILAVGDMHVTPDALNECNRLIDYSIEIGKQESVDVFCLLGDLYHSHSTINLSVMAFWKSAFERMAESLPRCLIIALVGNHDRSGVRYDNAHAMMLHNYSFLEIIDRPKVRNNILFVPYIADPNEFIEICNGFTNSFIYAHQEFAGSIYDNGFVTPTGVEPNLLNAKCIISGHIHLPQRKGKVWYIGAPRWRTVSDANIDRHIWVIEHSDNGDIVSEKSFSTKGICKPIYLLNDTIDNQAQVPNEECDIIIDVYGTKEYVINRRKELENQGVRSRGFPNPEKIIKVKASEGISKSFIKFMSEYKPANGTSNEILLQMSKERISWLRP